MTDAPDTVTAAVQLLQREGYRADLILRDGALVATDQGTACVVDDAVVERMYRFEGDSDPGDEMVVFGVHDTTNDVRGTLVSAFGLAADPENLGHLVYLASKVDG
jgi:hypothetical protein